MSHSSNWPIPTSGYDSLRIVTKRLDRQARNASPISAADLLGPGFSSQAIHILDLNDEVATFNGFFYISAGGLNTPEVLDEDDDPILLSWIGQVIARQDGTGTQQMWNTDDPGSMYFRVRNYAPNPADPTAPPIFGEWQRFATRSGFIAEEDLHPDVRDAIDQALEDAESGLHLAESVNKAYLQPTAPTNPDDDGRALVVNDPWFDSDDTNRPYRWNGSAWVNATTAWLDTNPTATFPNVVISPAGLVAYDGAGVAVTTIDSSNGFLTTTGSIFSAADISGSTVTGGVVQTTATVARGVKMNSAGFVAYDGSGSPTLVIDAATGGITMRGALLSGAGVIAGGSTTSGERVVLRPDGGGGVLEFFSGLSGETASSFDPQVFGGYAPGISISTGLVPGAGVTERAQIIMASDSPGVSSLDLSASLVSIGYFGSTGSVDIYGDTGLDGDLHVTGNLTVSGTYPSAGSTWVGTATTDLNMAGHAVNSASGVNSSGAVHGSTIFADSVPTTGTAVNAVMGASGQFLMFSSARKYKYDDEPFEVDLELVRELAHKRFRRYDDPEYSEEHPDASRWYYGVIANEAEALGLTPWCLYDADGELQSYDYVGFATAVGLAVARELEVLANRIQLLEAS